MTKKNLNQLKGTKPFQNLCEAFFILCLNSRPKSNERREMVITWRKDGITLWYTKNYVSFTSPST